MQLVNKGVCLILFVICIIYGIQYMQQQVAQSSPALHIPMVYVYAAIPIGFSLMVIYTIPEIVEIIWGKGEAE